jgi:hypothetical protein
MARHGWGFSRFEHVAHGIASDLASSFHSMRR